MQEAFEKIIEQLQEQEKFHADRSRSLRHKDHAHAFSQAIAIVEQVAQEYERAVADDGK